MFFLGVICDLKYWNSSIVIIDNVDRDYYMDLVDIDRSKHISNSFNENQYENTIDSSNEQLFTIKL